MREMDMHGARLPDDLDAALGELMRVERTARPAPSDALMARVLADAADIAGARAGGCAAAASAVEGRGVLRAAAAKAPAGQVAGRLMGRLGGAIAGLGARVGWPGGAAVAMASGLLIGVGIGYGLGEGMGASPFGGSDGLAAYGLVSPEEMFLAEAVPF